MEAFLANELLSLHLGQRHEPQQGLVGGDSNGTASLSSPIDFRHLPVIPSGDELLLKAEAAEASLDAVPKNIVDAPYQTAEEYLDTHFRLTRENLVRPTRDSIRAASGGIISPQGRRALRKYTNIVIKAPWCEKGRVCLLAHFDADAVGKKIDWSKRLLYGSLLCLSRDNFKTIRLATVAANDPAMLQKGVVLLFVEDDPNCVNDPLDLAPWKGTWVAVESPKFFLDCRYILANFQEVNLDSCPLASCILRFEGGRDAPGYVLARLAKSSEPLKIPSGIAGQEDHHMRMDRDGRLVWPSATDLGLDESQFEAFMAGIMRKVAIIQGPPGTGKTFLAAKIVRTLVKNRWWGQDSPILVISRTNRALDELLARLLEFTTMLVRVGSRSRHKDLKDWLYWSWLNQSEIELSRESECIAEMMSNLYRKRANVKGKIKKTLLCYSIVTSGAGVVKLNHLLATFKHTITGLPTKLDTVSWLGLKKGKKVGEDVIKAVLEKEKLVVKAAALQFAKKKPGQVRKWIDECNSQPGQSSEPSLLADGSAVLTMEVAATLVDHWYKLTSADDGSFRPYIQSNGGKQATSTQEAVLEGFFERSVTQCEQQLYKHESTIDQLEEQQQAAEHKAYKISKKIKKAEAAKLEKATQQASQQKTSSKNRSKQDKPSNAQQTDEENLAICEKQIAGYQKRLLKEREQVLELETIISSLQDAILLLRLPAVPTAVTVTFPKPACGIPSTFAELQKMALVDRFVLYRHLLNEWAQSSRGTLKNLLLKYQKVGKDLEESRCDEALALYKQMDIVGMTMTRAARDMETLERLKPKIVVCEEAAQAFESGIVGALPTSCEHLILIGDHRQLRPQPSAHELSREKKMNISLFERLVTNKMPHITLATQHRMRSDIADLIRPHMYENLGDSSDVNQQPPVPGVGCNVFFVTHKHLEAQEPHGRSYENVWEVNFLLALCEYLIKKGCEPSKINILTLYARQHAKFEETKAVYPSTEPVEVRTVDSYQGEEKEIILLSFVRSNEQNVAGFAKTANRANVALSRAKQGLFMVGNMELLRESSLFWENVDATLKEKGQIGDRLPLKPCAAHGQLFAENPEDFLEIMQSECCDRG